MINCRLFVKLRTKQLELNFITKSTLISYFCFSFVESIKLCDEIHILPSSLKKANYL